MHHITFLSTLYSSIASYHILNKTQVPTSSPELPHVSPPATLLLLTGAHWAQLSPLRVVTGCSFSGRVFPERCVTCSYTILSLCSDVNFPERPSVTTIPVYSHSALFFFNFFHLLFTCKYLLAYVLIVCLPHESVKSL